MAKIIGYVPQNIYLADDTISSNIAFGVDKENINQKQLRLLQKLRIYIILLKMNYLIIIELW